MHVCIISINVKKLKVDLTQGVSSQLQLGFIPVQVVANLLLPGFCPCLGKVPPKREMKFILYVCAQKRGGTMAIFHCSMEIFMYYWLLVHKYSL